MSSGTVKFFNPDKGFGFIVPSEGKDLFFHKNDIQSREPRDGEKVEFEIGQSKKGPCAINVRVVG
ncbi:cold-shock protein [Spartinivicinus ruber]|uniref:cold-shock protein n=1 Tax=Spartinivicinus ruber TaxID=2683272 RepID=UPI0013D43FBB|nr:cold-shock protein [Spartinivicinus ruber]